MKSSQKPSGCAKQAAKHARGTVGSPSKARRQTKKAHGQARREGQNKGLPTTNNKVSAARVTCWIQSQRGSGPTAQKTTKRPIIEFFTNQCRSLSFVFCFVFCCLFVLLWSRFSLSYVRYLCLFCVIILSLLAHIYATCILSCDILSSPCLCCC